MSSKNKKEDLRIVRTRHLLSNAFQTLIREKPFKEITIQSIANNAMVNRATFYDHFQDKYDLLDYNIREQFRQSLEAQIGHKDSFCPASLRGLARTVCLFMEQFHERGCRGRGDDLTPQIQRAIHGQIFDVLSGWLEEAAENGHIDKRVDTRFLASWVSWSIYGTGQHWSNNDAPDNLDQTVSQLMELIDQGVSSFTTDQSPSCQEAS